MFPQRHIGKSLISIAAIHTQQQRQKCSIIVCQTAYDRYINGQKQKKYEKFDYWKKSLLKSAYRNGFKHELKYDSACEITRNKLSKNVWWI